MDFPGGKVAYTSQIKFISGSSVKRIPCYRVLDDDGKLIRNNGLNFEQVIYPYFSQKVLWLKGSKDINIWVNSLLDICQSQFLFFSQNFCSSILFFFIFDMK